VKRAVVLACVVAASAACGKKGPPLPPLVHLPIAPPGITAERRGDIVDVTFTVPDVNTDKTKPANIDRVDVYAITAAPTVTDEQLLKRGTKVGSVAVKSPKDPNDVVDVDDQDEEVEPAVGAGLDQGVVAHVDETLTRQSFVPADLGRDRRTRTQDAGGGPMIGPPPTLTMRTYVAVGVSSRGKRGPFSKRVTAALIEPPATPQDVTMTYTEKAVTLTWSTVAATPELEGGVLPSRPLGVGAPSIAYNVYDVSAPRPATPEKVNKDPLTDATFEDPRITWGQKRCYSVRALATVGSAAVESAPSPPVCETLADTFPPAAPTGLKSVAGEKTINLIWDPSPESDLEGYIIFRGTGAADLQPLTPQPIKETNFSDDKVTPGTRYVYAVKAVDKTGNASPFSERVDETARE